MPARECCINFQFQVPGGNRYLRRLIMTGVTSRDFARARKAIGLYPGLSAAEIRAANALIDHFNKRTGQCDPSVKRLATLLAIDRATVMRATSKLDELGLIYRISHGGKSGRTQYYPAWDRLDAFVMDWERRMVDGSAPNNVAIPRPDRSQGCDKAGRKIATQTHTENPYKITHRRADPSKSKQTMVPAATTHGSGRRDTEVSPSKTPLRQRKPYPGQPRSQVAKQAAYRRWYKDLRKSCPDWQQFSALDQAITPEVEEAATEAEMRKRGTGINVVLKALEHLCADSMDTDGEAKQNERSGSNP